MEIHPAPSANQLRLQLVKGSGRQPWYLRLLAGNGEILATSEGYFSKWNAKRAARKNFPDVPISEQ